MPFFQRSSFYLASFSLSILSPVLFRLHSFFLSFPLPSLFFNHRSLMPVFINLAALYKTKYWAPRLPLEFLFCIWGPAQM
ncbi:hypothetical protein XENTR_v10019181 [Xenopus tropicalis]|nr:hypothetical protein XENTR_v10019181 [Xenopus tropicalis]